jgi:hypothetical protein
MWQLVLEITLVISVGNYYLNLCGLPCAIMLSCFVRVILPIVDSSALPQVLIKYVNSKFTPKMCRLVAMRVVGSLTSNAIRSQL